MSGCLSRSKASAQAQLSCGKVGGVENCFLSCLGQSLFMPGNPWPSGMGWVNVLLPGVHTCLPLLSRTEPSVELPVRNAPRQLAPWLSVDLDHICRGQS